MCTIKIKEEQHTSFIYRTQTGVHTGNEPGPYASEVCESEGTDTHFIRTMCKTQTADEHKQLSIAQDKQAHSANQLESNTTTNLIKQIVFLLSF